MNQAAILGKRRFAWGGRPYDHARYVPIRTVLHFLLRNFACRMLIRLERVEGLQNIPASGPAILMINHIAFVDPLVVMAVVPRLVVPLAKIEVYSLPVIGLFPKLYGVIPVRRFEVDRRALAMALEVLEAGEIVLVAPEGHRGPALQQAKEGMAFLAIRSGAPVVPVSIDGTVGYPSLDPRRWAGGGAQITFGRPFRLHAAPGESLREQLREMTDEAMGQVAAMLPPSRRGVYAASDPSLPKHLTLL
ncbi:MAG: lysophospholipid acyltransferase family protein [Anaerolineales bacterium]